MFGDSCKGAGEKRTDMETDNKKKKIVVQIAIFVVVFITQFIYYKISGGVAWGGDSKFYTGLAETLLTDGPVSFFYAARSPFYLLYPCFLAVITGLFGEAWDIVIIAQIIVYALTAILIFRILELIKSSLIVNAVLALAWSLLFENFHWVPYILTDANALFMVALPVYLYMLYIGLEGRKKNIIAACFFISLLLSFTSRTNTFILVGVLLLALFFHVPKKAKAILAVCAVGAIVCCLLVMLFVMKVDFTHIAKFFASFYGSGLFIDGKDIAFHTVPDEHMGKIWMVFDVLLILLERIIAYWAIWVKGNSMRHLALSVIQLVPFYIVSFYSVFLVLKRKAKRYYLFVALIFTYSLVQCTIFVMDFDFRYRIPVFIPMVIVAQYGVLGIVDYFKGLRGRKTQ